MKPTAYLAHAELDKVWEARHKIPVASEDEKTLSQLAADAMIDVARIRRDYPLKYVTRRHRDKIGYGRYISAESVAAVMEAGGVKAARPGDMTLSEIARELGFDRASVSTLRQLMTDEERGWAIKKRRGKGSPDGRAHVGLMWSREDGIRIVDRIRQMRSILPPYLLPLQALEGRLRVGVAAVRKRLQKEGGLIMLSLSGSRNTACLSWSQLAGLEAIYGLAPGVPVFDYSMLPASDSDDDPVRVAYARTVQAKSVPLNKLGINEDELKMLRKRLRS